MSEKIIMNDIEDIVKFAADNPEAKIKFAAGDVAKMIADAKSVGIDEGVVKAGQDAYRLLSDAVTKLNLDKQAIYNKGYNTGFAAGVLCTVAIVGMGYLLHKTGAANNERTKQND